MQIVWSETAIANLVEIRKYIEQDKPAAARRLAQRILLGQAPSGARTRASVERLAEHPTSGDPAANPKHANSSWPAHHTSLPTGFTGAACRFLPFCTPPKAGLKNSPTPRALASVQSPKQCRPRKPRGRSGAARTNASFHQCGSVCHPSGTRLWSSMPRR